VYKRQGLAAIIVGLQPILTAWFAAWISEKVTGRQWVGLVFGFTGVALVVAEKIGFAHIPLSSYALAFAALLSITFGTLYQKKFCPVFDLRAGSSIQFGVSAVLCFVCMYFFESGVMVWNAPVIGALLWAIFPLSIGSISLLFMMIRKGAATKVTSFLYLTPPTTAAMAWLLFDEPFTWLMAGGLALTMTGVVLVNSKQTNLIASIAE
jgi:drug/metabolite transporter (DMT)-like permease